MAASALFLLPCHADEAAGYRSKKKNSSSSFFFPTPEVRDLARTIQGGGGGGAPDSSVPAADRSNEAVLETASRHSTAFSFRLCKLPIAGSISPTIRDMVDEVKMGLLGGQTPKIASEGSGGVYFMRDRCGLTNVAVFKPMDEEPMALNNPRGFAASSHGEGLRKGSRSGEGALREVAAFLLDHPPSPSPSPAESPGGIISKTRSKLEIEGFSGVPPTTMMECYHSSFHYASDSWPLMHTKKAKKGSLQRFVHALSSCEDMGSSRFPVEEVHKISILDVRLANTDRNAGNILVSRRDDGELKLVPIDHGYCLPTKFEDCTFEWLYWPQAQEPYGDSALRYIESLDAEEDIALLGSCSWRLGPQVARVFRISTMLLKKGAAAGLTPFQIGSIMCRVESMDMPSPIEVLLEKAIALLPIHGEESDMLAILASLLDDYILTLN